MTYEQALDFLVEHGLVHRIEKLNAFIACGRPGERHEALFLICRDCGAVGETSAPVGGALDRTAEEAGFQVEAMTLEVEGVCRDCREAARHEANGCQ